MKERTLGSMTGKRRPTEEELKAVARAEEKTSAKVMRIETIACAVSAAIALLTGAGTVGAENAGGRTAGILMTAVFVLLAVLAAKSYLRTKRERFFFRKGNFLVVTGKVRGKMKASEYSGRRVVRFESDKGEVLEGLREVSARGLSEKSPLFLVYAEDEDYNKGRPYSKIYTEADLGIKIKTSPSGFRLTSGNRSSAETGADRMPEAYRNPKDAVCNEA